MKTLSILLLLIVTASASALQQPHNASKTRQIKTFTYDPDDVYMMHLLPRQQLRLKFAPCEEVVTITSGRPEAWTHIKSKAHPNNVMLRAKLPDASTNFTILTVGCQRKDHMGNIVNGREYDIIVTLGTDKGSRGLIHPDATFTAKWLYGDDMAMNEPMPAQFKQESNPATMTLENSNRDYSFSGDEIITPIFAADNGEFTVLEFRPNTPLPGLYRVNADGTETVIVPNISEHPTTKNRVFKFPGTHFQYTLRRGSYVSCVFNDAFSGYQRQPNHIRDAKRKVSRQ